MSYKAQDVRQAQFSDYCTFLLNAPFTDLQNQIMSSLCIYGNCNGGGGKKTGVCDCEEGKFDGCGVEDSETFWLGKGAITS